MYLDANSGIFSECSLILRGFQSDFDSAIPRFESWRPSQSCAAAAVRSNHPMSKLKISAGPFTFDARLETEAAPKTCAAFLKHMPFKSQIVHVR